MGTCGKGNGGGDPALVTNVREGIRSDSKSKESPMLVMNERHNDNGNGNIGEASVPLWERRHRTRWIRRWERQQTAPNAVMSNGATRGGGRVTRQRCNKMGVEALGNATTNQTKGAQQKVEA
jgi:hypothetical protein